MSIHDELGKLRKHKAVELRVQVAPAELIERIGRGVTRYGVDLTAPNVSVHPAGAKAAGGESATGYRELQTLAKEANVPASGSAKSIRQRLLARLTGSSGE